MQICNASQNVVEILNGSLCFFGPFKEKRHPVSIFPIPKHRMQLLWLHSSVGLLSGDRLQQKLGNTRSFLVSLEVERSTESNAKGILVLSLIVVVIDGFIFFVLISIKYFLC